MNYKEEIRARMGTAAQAPKGELSIYFPKGEEPHPAMVTYQQTGELDDGEIILHPRPVSDPGPWVGPGTPLHENAVGYGHQYIDSRVPVADFRRLQTYIGVTLATGLNEGVTERDFWRGVDDARADALADVLAGREEPMDVYDGVPMPYVELDKDGRVRGAQEGRHRTVAAEKVGLETIPFRLVLRTDKDRR